MSVPKDTVKSVSNRVTRHSRLSLLLAAGVLLIGVSVGGASLSSALSPSTQDLAYTYDCAGNFSRIQAPDLAPGDTITITATGTDCGGVIALIGGTFEPGDPVFRKNGTTYPFGSSTGVSPGDIFVLTAQPTGHAYGTIEFENDNGNVKIYDWVVDERLAPTTTTTMVQPTTTTTTTNQSPTSTTAPGGADAGSVAGDHVAPAFTG
jgi:hypothetical protein